MTDSGQTIIALPASPGRWRRLLRLAGDLGPVGPYAIAVTCVPMIGNVALLGFAMARGEWFRENAFLTIFLVSIGYGLVGGIALLPTYSVAVLAGWALGFATGFPAVWLGVSLAAALGYASARGVARNRVYSIIARSPRLSSLHDALLVGDFRRTVLIVFLWRLSPVVPFATTNMLLAAARVRFFPYLLGSILGVMPRTLVLCLVASRMSELNLSRFESWWTVVIGGAVTLAVIAIISLVARSALQRVTGPDVIGRALK